MRGLRYVMAAGLLLTGRLAGAAEVLATPNGSGHMRVLDQYCSECHNSTDWAGGVAFDVLQPDNIAADAEIWEEVVRKLRGGLMPPPGKPHPQAAVVAQFVSFMEGLLDDHAEQRADPGHVALHRINRTEYAQAVQHILGVKIDAATILPRETKSEGFDNVANVLRVSPTFLDQYISAAQTVSQIAVGDPQARAVSATYRAPPGRNATHREGMPLGTRGGFDIEHWFPADGEYDLSLRVQIGGGYGFGYGQQELILKVDGQRVRRIALGGEDDARNIDQRQAAAAAEVAARFQKIRVPIKAGPRRIAVTFTQESYAEDEARLFPFAPGGSSEGYGNVQSLDILGPFNPSGVSDTPSRRRIFTCRPISEADEPACARQIIARIARDAFRRPVTDDDLRAPLRFFADGRREGGFDQGIQSAITAVLSSPKFLYRLDNAPADLAPGSVFPLDDLAIASRLSFFLWSQGPDERLLQLASAGQLRDPAELDRQVRRMLADERSHTLVTNFARQWLNIDGLKDVDPDPALFPTFSEELRRAYAQEIELFADSVLRQDRSVVDLLTADYTFLNERLALQYGVRDVRGDQFRRVRLADSRRWGLLGKGGFLMLTSYGNRTAPVLRGAYILERITGTPPAAPPPGVEALPEKDANGGLATVRARLELHRSQPSCNACHGVMDPLGFALENFDAIGSWRNVDREAGLPVDAGDKLPDGRQIRGPDDLRAFLAGQPEQFVQALTEKLMTYALGRLVEYHDMPRIRAIVRESGAQGHRFVALVSGIVRSDQFLQGKVGAAAAPATPPQIAQSVAVATGKP
jgi:mono/diheme cytochrome c family protein